MRRLFSGPAAVREIVMYRFTDGKQGMLVPDTFAYCPVDGHKEGMEGKVIVNEGSGGSGGY